MTVKELEAYIILAKKHKLQSMHIGEIAFILREPTKRQSTRAVTQGAIAPTIEESMPSDQDMLYYSSEGAIQHLPTS